MKIKDDWKSLFLPFLMAVLLGISCNSSNSENQTNQQTVPVVTVTQKEAEVPKQGDNRNLIITDENTIQTRFAVPPNYKRTTIDSTSFQSYLRNLKLKPANALVQYYDGTKKSKEGVYVAVVDLEIGKKDLHQCADAIMRLRGEYLWNKGDYDKIHFNFTNGFTVAYEEWMKGRRMVIKGNKTYWNNRQQPSNTYQDFWKYMELIFTYAGTASLEKELQTVSIKEAEIGDILIQGGHPGHAVIIVDKAVPQETGQPIYLLAQSYMPAQETQILINPMNENFSPWYELGEGRIDTPEWGFRSSDLRRFKN